MVAKGGGKNFMGEVGDAIPTEMPDIRQIFIWVAGYIYCGMDTQADGCTED
jgi:hypothetical protein